MDNLIEYMDAEELYELTVMQAERRHVQELTLKGTVWQSSYYGKLAAGYIASGMMEARRWS